MHLRQKRPITAQPFQPRPVPNVRPNLDGHYKCLGHPLTNFREIQRPARIEHQKHIRGLRENS